ncbi:VOC family protein [Thalassobacillus sp. CUG 92003]|uniref:VOC family protein n=1 Tax=Thalassobacillus sp. CUG 92003 TaxID=2736641 RepID=UPI0015E751E7|nr:VOC family protein [Thalassobacillus sp. CUG 92003]
MFNLGSVFIPVTNLDTAKQWYEDNLGVIKVDEWSNGDDEGAGYCFKNGAAGLALIKVEKPQPTEFTIKGRKKNVYFNFSVEDIDAAHTRLKQNGVNTTDIEDHGDMKGFDFFDPDDNAFSVVSESIHSPYHHANIKKRQEEKT